MQEPESVLVACGLNWAELLHGLPLQERLPRRTAIMREKTLALRILLGKGFEFEALDALGAWTIRGPQLSRLPRLLAGSEFSIVPSTTLETHT